MIKIRHNVQIFEVRFLKIKQNMRKLNEEKHENESTLLPCVLPQVYNVNLHMTF